MNRNELLGDIVTAFSALTNAYYISSTEKELKNRYEDFNQKFRKYMKWLDANDIPRKESHIVQWVLKVDVLSILTHIKWIVAKMDL